MRTVKVKGGIVVHETFNGESVSENIGKSVHHIGLAGKHRPTPAYHPVEKTDWPLWAKAMRQFSTPYDQGIGDVVARIIGDENSAAFKSWYLATFGKPCGCNGRRAQWNLKYPLK